MPISWRETIVDSSNVSSWNYEYPSMITRVNSKRNLFMLWTGVSDTSGCDKILRYGLINDAAGDPSGTDMDPSCVIRTPRENSWNSDIGQYTSMEIDGNAVFITFTDWTNKGNEQLYFGYTPDGTKTDLSGGSWTFSAVEDNLKVEHVSLSITNHKIAHISYNVVNGKKLKHAFCNDVTFEDPQWTKSNVRFDGEDAIGQYSNIFADDSNVFIGWTSTVPKVYFSYTSETVPGVPINWTTSAGYDGGEYLSMAMNSIGIKAGYKQYQAFLSYRKDSKLYYICNTDVLNNEIWDISGEVHADDPSDISIAISQRNPSDDNPRAYIAFKTNDELKFVYTDNSTTEPLGGPWTSSDISGTEYSSNCSLAVTGRNVYVTHFNARTYGIVPPNYNNFPDGGVGWNPGEKFQFIFISSTFSSPLSSNINDYNFFVNNVWANSALKDDIENFVGPICWRCIGSTSTVDAKENVGAGSGVDFGGIYRLDGLKVADDETHLWGVGIGAGGLHNPVKRNENGVENSTPGNIDAHPWTGTHHQGTADVGYELGNNTTGKWRVGFRSGTGSGWVDWQEYNLTDEGANGIRSLYALSEVLTWPPAIPARPGDLIISCWKVPVLETLQAGNF